MPVLPLSTGRLRLRLMAPADAAALAGYRNDPEVARWQSWALPYGITDAGLLLADQADLTDVIPGRWVQIAIDHEGRPIGDVAVRLDAAASVATLGYSLSREAQGHGYAREAVTAVVDAIFAQTSVRRIQADIDPRNYASMRVVESVGFGYEGRSRGVGVVRGELVDDIRFGLLGTDRHRWLSRPVIPPESVELVPLSSENLDEVRRLKTFWYQRQFVAPMAKSLAQALVPPRYDDGAAIVPWYRAAVADGTVVGFVMVAGATDGHPAPYLWRLLIDHRHQRRGIGARILDLLAEHFRSEHRPALLVSFTDAPGGPGEFYRRLGFVETRPTGEGEIEAQLPLG